MKKQLIILIGAPCSGKSTWAKEFVISNSDTLRFNRDEIRLMLQGRLNLKEADEDTVTVMINEGIYKALSENRNVIIDQTNCKLKYINGFLKSYEDREDIEIKFKIIHQPLSLLYERNVNRARTMGLPKIPDHIISNMHDNLQKMIQTSEFKKLLDKYGSLV